MPYDASDPRSKLSTAGSTPAGSPRRPTYRELHEDSPDEVLDNGSATWLTRSQAMVLAHTEGRAGDVLAVDAAGEYVVLVIDDTRITVEHDGRSEQVGESAVVIVPSGASTVTIDGPGIVIRVFGAPTVPELAARCSNATDYDVPDANVAEWRPWPLPPAGERIRVYTFADHPLEDGRLGRLIRCSTVMVNAFGRQTDEREFTTVSPHHHADFEQISVQIEGDFTHHMRVPWTPQISEWRDDEHHRTASPATVVIPPPLIHTTQPSSGRRYLIDVFAPPRFDFSEQPGWVRNADEYPVPARSIDGSAA